MSLNKILAALLVVFFLIFTLVVILTWSVRANILDADTYVQALDGADFFEVPYQLIGDGTIPQAGGLLLEEGPLSAVSGADLEAVARELAPPDWLRAQLERAIRDLLAVAEEPELNELPDLVISLREVKARALGAPGDRALAIVIAALLECPPGQLPVDLNSDVPVCKPAGMDLTPFQDQLKALLSPLVQRVPDTYHVRWQPEQREVLEDLQRAGQTLDQVQIALLLLLALNLALLGLIWLLAVRSPAEWLRWTGGPLLMSGLLVLLPGLLAPRLIAWGVEDRGLWSEGNVPASLARALERAIVDLAAVLFRPAVLTGVFLVIVGLLLLLVSPLFPGRRRRVPPAPTRTAH